MPKNDYDSPWKDILTRYFQEFMAFFFPGIATEIAWERGYELLDKEFQKVVRQAKTGRRYADLLVRVFQRNGEERWVLVHVEVQGARDREFAKRMFTYNYRIFDRYDRPVVSLAVLADPHPGWRPDGYSWSLWGCTMGLNFPVAKLLDHGADWDALGASDNPFAACTMAQLKAMEAKDEEEERAMPYVTSAERFGFRRGIQQGIQQGSLTEAREMVCEALATRFGELDASVRERIEAITERDRLRALFRRALTAKDLNEFIEAMNDA